jgi:hypothetical protein
MFQFTRVLTIQVRTQICRNVGSMFVSLDEASAAISVSHTIDRAPTSASNSQYFSLDFNEYTCFLIRVSHFDIESAGRHQTSLNHLVVGL